MNEKRITQNAPVPAGGKVLIAIVIGLLGAAGGAYFGMSDQDSQSSSSPFDRSNPASPTMSVELDRLQHALAAEVEAREELTARIAKLEASLSRRGAEFGEAPLASLADTEAQEGDVEPDENDEAEALALAERDAEASKFDDGALLALGAHPRDIERLRDRWVRFELEKEALANQALREGWFQQPRHRGQLIGMEIALRKELQDDDYDRYLYALGRKNRLEAGEVLTGSSASDAGLRQGDIIVRYDDVRIFGPGELMVASSSGSTGGSVPLEILRDGRRRTLYVERGPLGALMEHNRAAPLSN